MDKPQHRINRHAVLFALALALGADAAAQVPAPAPAPASIPTATDNPHPVVPAPPVSSSDIKPSQPTYSVQLQKPSPAATNSTTPNSSTPTTPAHHPTTYPEPSEVIQLRIQHALDQYTLQQQHLAAIQAELSAAPQTMEQYKQTVLIEIDHARKTENVPDTWGYDFAHHSWIAPEPAAAGAVAAKPAAAKPAAPAKTPAKK